MEKVVANGSKYSIEKYVTMLKLAKRSQETITSYENKLKAYAEFLKVPAEELHNHLTSDNLIKYAAHLMTTMSDGKRGRKTVTYGKKGKKKQEESTARPRSGAGNKTVLSTIRRFYTVNGVKLDVLEYNAVNPTPEPETNDKPLELKTLQKMFDLTDVHGKAFLSFLISTGCRAGEACKIELRDLKGDHVVVRNEIAKRRQGGIVYLTSEAQEFINLWLSQRDAHINLADRRAKGLAKLGAIRPKNDNRLFGMSYSSANRMFNRLYDKVDGSKGKYGHRECSIHSCRKYFRTHAAKGMHPDLVTSLMRQRGYLDNTYVKKTEAEKRKEFFEGQVELFVTRPDHRIQAGQLEKIKSAEEKDAAISDMQNQVKEMEATIAEFIKRFGKPTDIESLPTATGSKY